MRGSVQDAGMHMNGVTHHRGDRRAGRQPRVLHRRPRAAAGEEDGKSGRGLLGRPSPLRGRTGLAGHGSHVLRPAGSAWTKRVQRRSHSGSNAPEARLAWCRPANGSHPAAAPGAIIGRSWAWWRTWRKGSRCQARGRRTARVHFQLPDGRPALRSRPPPALAGGHSCTAV